MRFPSGTYRSPNSIHSGATIMGAGGSGYDKPEPNPHDEYQDHGHSHFHNAMIWGDRLTNIGFVGSGTIDGCGARHQRHDHQRRLRRQRLPAHPDPCSDNTEGSPKTFRLYAKGFRAGEVQLKPNGGASNYSVIVK